MSQELLKKKCIPCEGISKSLGKKKVLDLLKTLPKWQMAKDHKKIFRVFNLKNFVQCVEMINKIKDIAEGEGHHPDLHLTEYKNLRVISYTHAVDGLTENDFILAAKIDKLG